MYQYPVHPDELYHHGIPGQKWGRRRYQNPDGSLTALGRSRLIKDAYREEERNKKIDAKIAKKVEKEELKKQKEYIKKQLSKDIANQKKSVYRMSNEELNNEMDRLNKMKTTLELRRSVEKLSSKKLSDVKQDDKQKGLLNLIISASKVKASEAVSEVLKDKIKDHFKKSPNKYEEAKREAEYWSNVNTAYRNKKEYSKKSPDKYEEAKRNADYWSNLNKASRNKKEYYKNNTSVNNNQ